MGKIRKLMIIICLFVFTNSCFAAGGEVQTDIDDIRFVFVHGLSGWGSYDANYKRMPYWGMFGGDLISYLNQQGYPSYAASVARKAAPGTWHASFTPS